MAIVVAFPFLQFCSDIDVIDIVDQLPELLFVRPVRAFNFPIQMWRCWLDVDMANAEVFAVPVKLGLKFVAVISLNSRDAEGEGLPDVVHEPFGVLLRVTIIDLQCPRPGCVVNGSILKTPDFPAILLESQKLDIDLNPSQRCNASPVGSGCPGTCFS